MFLKTRFQDKFTNTLRFKRCIYTNSQLFKITETKDELESKIHETINQSNKTLSIVYEDPVKSYEKFVNKKFNHSSTELIPICDYLEASIKLKLLDKSLSKPLENSLIMLGHIKLMNLYNIGYSSKQIPYKYDTTVKTIANTLEFFDIIERQNQLEYPAYYHTYNYKYYFDNFLQNNESHILPILNNPGASGFIKLRPVPIYLAGIQTVSTMVDEFFQTPLEFFYHDVNHGRRMHEHFLKYIDQKELNISGAIYKASTFTKQLLSLIKINKTDTNEIIGHKQLIKMLIFEIVHEDALYICPEILWNALHRDEEYKYIFEKTVIKNKKLDVIDQPIIVDGASAYTKFKLQHKFYDDGCNANIVLPEFRYAHYITNAVIILLRFLQAKVFPNREIKDYKYYFTKTCSNQFTPKPIHHFCVGSDHNASNIDTHALKSGLRQNYWLDGYRRLPGEHIRLNENTNSIAIQEEPNETFMNKCFNNILPLSCFEVTGIN